MRPDVGQSGREDEVREQDRAPDVAFASVAVDEGFRKGVAVAGRTDTGGVGSVILIIVRGVDVVSAAVGIQRDVLRRTAVTARGEEQSAVTRVRQGREPLCRRVGDCGHRMFPLQNRLFAALRRNTDADGEPMTRKR